MSRYYARARTLTTRKTVSQILGTGSRPVEPPVPEFDASLLPLGQQLALITAHESHFKRALVWRMAQELGHPATWQDYAALVDMDLATRRPADRWHTLTAQGNSAAIWLEANLLRKYKIGHEDDRASGRGGNSWSRNGCGDSFYA